MKKIFLGTIFLFANCVVCSARQLPVIREITEITKQNLDILNQNFHKLSIKTEGKHNRIIYNNVMNIELYNRPLDYAGAVAQCIYNLKDFVEIYSIGSAHEVYDMISDLEALANTSKNFGEITFANGDHTVLRKYCDDSILNCLILDDDIEIIKKFANEHIPNAIRLIEEMQAKLNR